jgi:hypothetical protein
LGAFSADLDQRTASATFGHDDGAIDACATAAKDDSACVEMELAPNPETSRMEEYRSAKSIGFQWERCHMIDGGLEQRGVVGARGSYRYCGGDCRDRLTASLKARE